MGGCPRSAGRVVQCDIVARVQYSYSVLRVVFGSWHESKDQYDDAKTLHVKSVCSFSELARTVGRGVASRNDTSPYIPNNVYLLNINQRLLSSSYSHGTMGLLDKIKNRRSGPGSDNTNFPPPAAPQPLGPAAIQRYRKQRGVNLGSWFVLERWICPQLFQTAAPPGQSDYDVARGKDAKQSLEAHWDGWIKDEDWKWIKAKGFNSVRIPVRHGCIRM